MKKKPSVVGIPNRPFSAVIEVKLENKILNALLDTGASCSIIDLGTIQNLGFDKNITKSNHDLIDASGNAMSIAG